MRFKKIVGFGDSWMWGDELLDPALANHIHAHPCIKENTKYRESKCFLGLLGRHFDVPVENFGIPGGSLQSSIWTYLWWLEHEHLPPDECLILVALADPGRQTFYNPNHVSYGDDANWNRFVHSMWVHSGNSNLASAWQELVKNHLVLTDCAQAQMLNFQQTILFFDGQGHSHNNNVLQFNTALKKRYSGCRSLSYNGDPLIALINQAELAAPLGHPNEKGHEVIRDSLIKEIDCAILAQ